MSIAAPSPGACMGRADRVGTLAPPRDADLVAVGGDPLTEITVLGRPVVVLKGGHPVSDQRAG